MLPRISSDILDLTDYLFTIRIRAEIKIEIEMLLRRVAAQDRGGRGGGGLWRRQRAAASLSFGGFGVGSSNMMKPMDLKNLSDLEIA